MSEEDFVTSTACTRQLYRPSTQFSNTCNSSWSRSTTRSCSPLSTLDSRTYNKRFFDQRTSLLWTLLIFFHCRSPYSFVLRYGFVIHSTGLPILAEETAPTSAWYILPSTNILRLVLFVESFLPIHVKTMWDEIKAQVHLELVSAPILWQVLMPLMILVCCQSGNDMIGSM